MSLLCQLSLIFPLFYSLLLMFVEVFSSLLPLGALVLLDNNWIKGEAWKPQIKIHNPYISIFLTSQEISSTTFSQVLLQPGLHRN